MDFGSYVRSARERQSLSIDQVAAATKLNRQLLLDLEANDIRRWPKQEVYRRGFLRSYSHAIRLDPEDVLVRFDREFEISEPVVVIEMPVAPTRVSEPLLSRMKVEFAEWRRLATPVALGVGLLFGLIALTLQDQPGSAGSVVSQQVAPVVNAAAAPQEHAAEPNAATAIVSPPAEANPEKNAQPEPAQIEGTLTIDSDPRGATVTVNGIGRGQTPVNIRYLPLGSYEIRVVLAGHRAVEQYVTLNAERPTRTAKVRLKSF